MSRDECKKEKVFTAAISSGILFFRSWEVLRPSKKDLKVIAQNDESGILETEAKISGSKLVK